MKKKHTALILAITSITSLTLFANSSPIGFYGGTNSNEKQRLAAIGKFNEPVKVSVVINKANNQASQNQNSSNSSQDNNNNQDNTNVQQVPAQYSAYDLNEYASKGTPNRMTQGQNKKSQPKKASIAMSKEKAERLVQYIHTQNPKLSRNEIYGILEKVWRHSRNYKMNPYLVLAVMNTESDFKHSTVSRAGAMGLMQLMDFNLREFGVNNSVEGNIKGGVMHLARDYYNHGGSVIKTLVCYNAGCKRLNGNAWKNIKETREYIPKVKRYFDKLISL